MQSGWAPVSTDFQEESTIVTEDDRWLKNPSASEPTSMACAPPPVLSPMMTVPFSLARTGVRFSSSASSSEIRGWIAGLGLEAAA